MFAFDSMASLHINWLEIKYILILLFAILAICTILIFVLNSKSKKAILITKIVFAVLLFVLEIGRFVWWYFRCKHYGDPFNVWKRINFEMCSMMVWLNILTLLLSIFVKKENKFLNCLYNVIFGAGLIGGIITFIYPAFIDNYYSIFHFRNLQSIITHIILIVNPLYLLKTKHFKLQLKNFWVIPFSLTCVGSISSFASICANHNFAYSFFCKPLSVLNVNIAFPFQVLVLLIIISSIQFLIYSIAEVIRKKRKKETYSKIGLFEISCFVITVVYIVCHLICLNYLSKYTPSLLGIIMLVPFALSISSVFISYVLIKKNTNKNL